MSMSPRLVPQLAPAVGACRRALSSSSSSRSSLLSWSTNTRADPSRACRAISSSAIAPTLLSSASSSIAPNGQKTPHSSAFSSSRFPSSSLTSSHSTTPARHLLHPPHTRSIHTHSFNPPPSFLFPQRPPSTRNALAMAAFPDLAPLLTGNQQWAAATNAADPALLPTLAKGQAPPVLWIGCADSRVPECTITQRNLGDIFVHRNVANQFQVDDTSANALLNYGVLTVGVDHVVVVGHTSCGGCNAAYDAPKPTGPNAAGDHLGTFLRPIIDLRHSLPANATVDDLIKENIRMNVKNVVESPTMKEAWAKGRKVYVHGWLFDVKSGLLNDLGVSQGPQ